MPLLDLLLSIVAPHECLVCTQEGGLLCVACAALYCPLAPFITPPPNIDHMWVRTEYTGATKRILKQYKFDRAWAAHQLIAGLMLDVLPDLPLATIVTAVPTASSRSRQRGYDHAAMLARYVAKTRRLPYCPLVSRQGQSRQVGASKKQRRHQLQGAFSVVKPQFVVGQSVLLIDDVITTGASLEVAAATLLEAGAATVDALVFACKN